MQRACHSGRSAADDNHIGRHLRTGDPFESLAEDQHVIAGRTKRPTMINASRTLAKRIGNHELFANSACSGVLNLAMTRHRACAMRLRIVIDAVTAAFPNEHATMSF